MSLEVSTSYTEVQNSKQTHNTHRVYKSSSCSRSCRYSSKSFFRSTKRNETLFSNVVIYILNVSDRVSKITFLNELNNFLKDNIGVLKIVKIITA